jgi:hypothetical protein
MATQSRDIAEAIRTLSGMDDLTYESLVCTIIKGSIDTTNMTCDCDPLDGSAYLLDVRLNANYTKGFTLIPKDESIVIVTQLSDATAYVSMVSDVDQIYLAGDDNGGLVKVSELVDKINRVENQVNNILNVLKTTVIPLAPSGTYPFAPLYASILDITPLTQVNDLENKTVQHGNG